MAKCKMCGKKGLFLKVDVDGVCNDCVRLNAIKKDEIETLKKLDEYSLILSDKVALVEKTQKEALAEIDRDIQRKNSQLSYTANTLAQKELKLYEVNENLEKQDKAVLSASNKVVKLKSISKSLDHVIKNYYTSTSLSYDVRIPNFDEEIAQNLSPTVHLQFHAMSIKELRKRFTNNTNAINELLEQYSQRYTTKANLTIYKLIVLGLEAELQNILTNLKYQKLDLSVTDVKKMILKYIQIATDGSQTIASTIIKFLGQLEYFYIEAINIEYEYFVQKEKIKDEQRILREQMREEERERKLLEQQQKQVEKEESKYRTEVEALKATLSLSTDDEKSEQLNRRINELEEQLLKVQEKKEEIIKLQNGKAGYVYVISNLGSFGDKVFKVGMTRRLEPQERVDELGSASVPFPFDVHSFIFSNDAVGLENNIHKTLTERRINKINMRKEFFDISVDELETLVQNLEPTAEFTTTMLATQYRQSISLSKDQINYNFAEDDVDEDELDV